MALWQALAMRGSIKGAQGTRAHPILRVGEEILWQDIGQRAADIHHRRKVSVDSAQCRFYQLVY